MAGRSPPENANPEVTWMFPICDRAPFALKYLAAALCLALAAPQARAADDCCEKPKKAIRQDAGDPFAAAAMGMLPLASGFYVSDSPKKGIVFSLADIMLIGTIIQIRNNDSLPRSDVATYYYLLGAVNIADAVLSVLQVRSDAAKRVSLNIIPSQEPKVVLGVRF